jgi:hypothetical protein
MARIIRITLVALVAWFVWTAIDSIDLDSTNYNASAQIMALEAEGL